jgi:DNA polymerase-3 subunit delta'
MLDLDHQEFLGNTPIVRRLRNKVSEGRLPHGMIFSGPEGIGKRTFALEIAQALNCQVRKSDQGKSETLQPCRTCDSCRKIFTGTHPEVTTMTLEDDASVIKIDQVRRIRSQLEIDALAGSARVILIDPANAMNKSASNAMLKSLEEPPPRTFFILITDNAHELEVTIRSRCQIYHFSPLRLDEVRNSGIHDELVVRWSQGSIGRALATDPDQLRELRDELLEFLERVVTSSESELVSLIGASADLARSKDEYREKIRALGVLVSDLLYMKEGMEERLVNLDETERIRTIALAVDLDRIFQIGDCIRFIENALKHYVNRQMLTDTLALTMNPGTAELLNDKRWEYR